MTYRPRNLVLMYNSSSNSKKKQVTIMIPDINTCSNDQLREAYIALGRVLREVRISYEAAVTTLEGD